ncbi:GntR family transcriptional regulator [Humitalea sp. 24SJ18S-53]|uniref:GntR family transcriptional regulator n=1 Tax=Humitalea sp. 24SJ18S-53 TaxID=3422307 RepID=UPI003D671836
MSNLLSPPEDPPGTPDAPDRRSVAEVVAILRQRIVTRILAPGARIRERDIATELGASRAVIRDALATLAQRHLVKRYPNRGAEVARLGRAEILSLYEVREGVEGLCARLATERAPPGHWADLVALFGAPAEAAIERHAFDIYVGYIVQLDNRMIAAAANPDLEELLGALADRSAVLARRSVFLPGRAAQGLVLHRATLDAMHRRDAVAAEQIKRENLRLARDYLIRFEEYVV